MPRVFISSTNEDLKPHREAARDAALKAGFECCMMEYFSAQGESVPYKACMKKVAECDVLVAIVAHRYGWVPPDQPGLSQERTKSITWLECEKARKLKPRREVLAFVVDEKCSWPAEMRESYRLEQGVSAEEVTRNLAQLRNFKTWLGRLGFRSTFTDPKDLETAALAALNDWRERHRDLAADRKQPSRPKADSLPDRSNRIGGAGAELSECESSGPPRVLIHSDMALPEKWVESTEDTARLLALLNRKTDTPHVIAIEGIGGSGKSCFARDFFARIAENFRCDLGVWFSFYRLRGQVDPFGHLLDFLLERLDRRYVDERRSAEQKQIRVEELLRDQKAFVVLDGLEVAQQGDLHDPSYGKLINPEFARFLQSSLNFTMSRILITTRVPVSELMDRRGYTRFELSEWTVEKILEYVRSNGIQMNSQDAKQLVELLGSHRLTLAIFCYVLREYYGGSFKQVPLRDWISAGDPQVAKLVAVLEDCWKHLGVHEQFLLKHLSALYGEGDENTLSVLTDLDPTSPGFRRMRQNLLRSGLVIRGEREGRPTQTAHPLVKQFCYAKMSEADRREVHRRLAEHFEKRPKPDVPRKAADLEDFVEWFHQCLRGELFQAAYQILEQRALRSALYYIGWYQAQLELIESLTAKALSAESHSLGSTERIALIMARGHVARKLGRPPEALSYFEDARRLAAENGLEEQEYGANTELAITHGFCGEYGKALQLLPAQCLARETYYDAPRLEWLGVCLAMLGQPEEAIVALKEAESLARSRNDDRHLPPILTHLGDVLLRLNRVEAAQGAFCQAWKVSRQKKYRDYEGDAARGISDLYRRRGRTIQAGLWLHKALRIAEHLGYQFLRAEALVSLSRLLDATPGHGGEAYGVAATALGLARESGYRFIEAAAHMLLARTGSNLPLQDRWTHAVDARKITSQIGSALLDSDIHEVHSMIANCELNLHYTGLWERHQPAWSARRSPVAAMKDGIPVPQDFCLTTVARLMEQPVQPIDQVKWIIEVLRAVAAHQFFYPPESLHLTLLGCTQRSRHLADFNQERIRAIVRACSESLAGAKSIRVRFRGLGIIDAQVFLQGFPSDCTWAKLRMNLAAGLMEIGEEPISYPNKLPVHLNVARIIQRHDAERRRVLRQVEQWRDQDFGEALINCVDLVLTDFVLSAGGTKQLERYMLSGA